MPCSVSVLYSVPTFGVSGCTKWSKIYFFVTLLKTITLPSTVEPLPVLEMCSVTWKMVCDRPLQKSHFILTVSLADASQPVWVGPLD